VNRMRGRDSNISAFFFVRGWDDGEYNSFFSILLSFFLAPHWIGVTDNLACSIYFSVA